MCFEHSGNPRKVPILINLLINFDLEKCFKDHSCVKVNSSISKWYCYLGLKSKANLLSAQKKIREWRKISNVLVPFAILLHCIIFHLFILFLVSHWAISYVRTENTIILFINVYAEIYIYIFLHTYIKSWNDVKPIPQKLGILQIMCVLLWSLSNKPLKKEIRSRSSLSRN
jgi:hypothetical protein